MKLLPRLLMLLLLLLAIQVVAFAMVRSGTPRGVTLPATELAEMPKQLGDWVCSDAGQRDADAEDRSGAAVSIHRVYRNADERAAISAYVAIWTEYSDELPHPPSACYRGSGHTILGSGEIELKGSNGSRLEAQLMTSTMDQQPVYVLYWYRAGRVIAMENKELRDIRRTYRGEKNWPPLVKVMLDIRGTDETTARRLLTDFGQQILAWTSQKL